MIIRHGEKPGEKHTGNLPGVAANGSADDGSLTRIGWERARALASILAPDGSQPRTGLARPTAIFAARADDKGKGLRTRETVAPLAQKLGIPVDTQFGKGDVGELVSTVKSRTGATLICWQHSEIPDIARDFGAVTPAPPRTWPDKEYDVIWTLTKTATGWAFAQMPEMALPQDDRNVIPG